jgi:hypothetical protein
MTDMREVLKVASAGGDRNKLTLKVLMLCMSEAIKFMQKKIPNRSIMMLLLRLHILKNFIYDYKFSFIAF